MIARAIGVALILFSVAQPGEAAQPINDWKIEPSDARCVAVRQYGDPETPVTLALKAPPTGRALQVAIIRNIYRKTSGQIDATIDLDGTIFPTSGIAYPRDYPKRSQWSVSLLHLSPEAAAALRSARNLGVKVKGWPGDTFSLTGMDRALSSIDSCLERLRDTWNIGESNKTRISVEAKPLIPIAGMLSGQDFPPQAAQKNWAGTTKFMLLIDETGKVRDCVLIESSGQAVIDSRTCAVITHKARFAPAADVNGKAIKSTFSEDIRWVVTD